MKWLRNFLFVLLLSCSVLYAQDVSQPDTELTTLSSNIKDSLQNIKLQSMLISEELTQVQNELKVSEEERTALQRQSTELSASLMSINEQLNDYYKTITIYEERLRRQKKILTSLSMILLALILIKILFIFLYIKKIPIPRIVDILA